MRRFEVSPGDRFGRCVAIELDRFDKVQGQYWLFKCEVCGGEGIGKVALVRRRGGIACECYAKIFASGNSNPHYKHGHTVKMGKSPEWRTWNSMLQRCNNPYHTSYERYGAIGITVCERWYRFENFLADMGPRPLGHSLDRIDPWGHYEPENCRWADATTQALNRRKWPE